MKHQPPQPVFRLGPITTVFSQSRLKVTAYQRLWWRVLRNTGLPGISAIGVRAEAYFSPTLSSRSHSLQVFDK
jgi:hypothetical protein